MKIKKVDKAKKGMFRQYRAALKEFKQSIKTKNSSIKMSIRNCVCTWKLGKQGIDGSHMKCRNEVSQFGKKLPRPLCQQHSLRQERIVAIPKSVHAERIQ